VPPYVEREFHRYLECGVLLAHGFVRARCGDCGHDFLIAFSCKGRGV
jgi:ribosomal protein S27AE